MTIDERIKAIREREKHKAERADPWLTEHPCDDIPYLLTRLEIALRALREIACYDDHPELAGFSHLDELAAARKARKALEEIEKC